jgi:hypothetical protein
MKKLILLLSIMLCILFVNVNNVYAYDTFTIDGLSDNSYKLLMRIQNKTTGAVDTIYSGQKLKDFNIVYSLKKKVYDENTNKSYYGIVNSDYAWENPEYTITKGTQDVNLIFYLDDGTSLKVKININSKDFIDEQVIIDNDPTNEDMSLFETQSIQSFSTTLTANTILLNEESTYDINLVDKVSGSTYEWSSSNTKVAKVDKKGNVTAIKEGKAKITCKVTTPDKETYELSSDVIVGIDDNFPLLTETVLDLEVENLFDLNIENKIKGSKYKWSTSDRKIAKVNSANGKVTATGVGEATVYCTINTGKEIIVLSCKVYVTE